MQAPIHPSAGGFFRSVRCPHCSVALAADAWEGGGAVRCPRCRSQLSARIFSALGRVPPVPGAGAGERAMEGEAVCFFHPEKKAERSCDRCGRFVCALCDLPVGARHVCPTCLGSGLGTEKLPEIVARRVCWPHLALTFGWLPLALGWALWPLLFMTGPVAIGVALYGWSKPGSLVHGRRRWMAALAILLGLVQLAIPASVVFFIWRSNAGA